MANVLGTILTTVQTSLRAMTLTPADSEVSTIASGAIVIRKVAPREKGFEEGHLIEELSGILIVPGTTECPPSAGNNTSDDVTYNVDIVICARDDLRETGVNTYTQWMQTIRQYFNNSVSGTPTWPSDAASGIVWNVFALACDAVNDWRWINHREAVTGVRLKLISREPRG